MSWKRLDKDKKIFIVLGIPCFIFVFFALFSFYILFSSFYLIILVVSILALVRKKQTGLRLTKVGVLMVIIFFFNFYNIFILPSQFERHFIGGRQSLLEPDHPKIEDLKEDFNEWHLEKYNVSFDSLIEDSREDLALKLKRVDHFIHTKVFKYTSDSETYYSSEHIPTLDEIFKSDSDGDGLLEDDCDGISVLTASLLLNMEYHAYVSECLSHWNTIVFPEGCDPKTLEGFEKGIHLYNWWGRPSYYIFNQTEVIIPPGRPITLSFFELFMESGTYEEFAYLFFEGFFGLPLFITILIVYIALLIAALVIYVIVKIGLPRSTLEKKQKRRRFFKTILITSLIGAYVAFIIFWLAISGLGFLGTIILSCTVIVVCKYIEFRITSK